MIYKIKMMSGAEIPVAGDDDLKKILDQVERGAPLVATKYGVINPKSIDSILPDKERMATVNGYMQMRREDGGNLVQAYTQEEAEAKTLGSSPFAKALAGGMEMLNAGERSIAQEDGARGSRGGK